MIWKPSPNVPHTFALALAVLFSSFFIHIIQPQYHTLSYQWRRARRRNLYFLGQGTFCFLFRVFVCNAWLGSITPWSCVASWLPWLCWLCWLFVAFFPCSVPLAFRFLALAAQTACKTSTQQQGKGALHLDLSRSLSSKPARCRSTPAIAAI